jgi:hypothetical protein
MNPKLVAAALLGGTFVLGGGSALLAEHPSPARSVAAETAVQAPTATAMRTTPLTTTSTTTLTLTQPSRPVPTPPQAKAAPRVSKVPTRSPVDHSPKARVRASAVPPVLIVKTVTYRVTAGDTPSSVARWFGRHGYAAAYAAGRAAIDGPNGLAPGELVSIMNGKLTVQPLG